MRSVSAGPKCSRSCSAVDDKSSDEEGNSPPKGKREIPSEWHLQRAEDLAWWTRQEANASAAGFIHSGIGIAGLAFIALMSREVTARAASLLLPVAAGLLLISLGAGLVALHRRRNRQLAHAMVNHRNVQLQRALHDQSPDPKYAGKSIEELQAEHAEARDAVDSCPGEKPWIHIQFIFLIMAFLAVLAFPVMGAYAAW